MKKIFVPLLIIAATVSVAVSGLYASAPTGTQRVVSDPPDMEKIKAEVNNPSSRYYYPKLFARYEQNETVMNMDEYRHLYLGALFQEDFDPYRHGPNDSKIEELYYRSNHTRAELDTIISYAEESLLDDPFDLAQINYLIFALRQRGKVNRANIWQYRLNHLLEAILSTGTGLDAENAWVVIDPKHEYNIINFQNAVADRSEFKEPYYEYVTIKQDAQRKDSRPEGYYFNIRYLLEEYYRKHPEQK